MRCLILSLLIAPLQADEIALDYENQSVEKRLPSGQLLWATPLKGGIMQHREPHLLTDAVRVYVSHGDGISALDRVTGKVLWSAKAPNSRLYLSDGLLLSVDCTSGDHVGKEGRLFTARTPVSGAEVFRTRLPVKDFDPDPLRELGGLYLVQTHGWRDQKDVALLIDPRGEVVLRFDHRVIDARADGTDGVFLTSDGLVRVTPKGRVRWKVSMKGDSLTSGGLLDLRGGDLVAFVYCPIADSGVRLVRLTPATGEVVWRTACKPLGVSHSKYRHDVVVSVEGDRLRVGSKGSFGDFVEVLDAATGKQRERTRPKRGGVDIR